MIRRDYNRSARVEGRVAKRRSKGDMLGMARNLKHRILAIAEEEGASKVGYPLAASA
jgi:hypothetical protein